MKCKLTEMWHSSPEECRCVKKLHLRTSKYCICFSGIHCRDTWQIVNQERAARLWDLINNKQLEEFFEYV